MPRDVASNALYSGQINLWVEDDLTRSYLSALWSDPAVKFLIGGSRNGVIAILQDSEDSGYTNVFGLIDRDHGKTNYADWFVPTRTFRRFILPRHEIENYLLDSPALQGCKFNKHNRSVEDIDQFLNKTAQGRCWWMACCDVVSQIRELFFDKFIKHPKTHPDDTEAAARESITQTEWFKALQDKTSKMSEANVHELLSKAHKQAITALETDDWRSMFAGKEIVRAVGGFIFNHSKNPTYKRSPAVFESDLAKGVAAWQVKHEAIPQELVELLGTLKARISLKPA